MTSFYLFGLHYYYRKFSSPFWRKLNWTVVTLGTANDISTYFCTLYCLWIAIKKAQEKINILEKLREIDFLLRMKKLSKKMRLAPLLALHMLLVLVGNQIMFPGFNVNSFSQFGKLIKTCAVVELIELVLSIKDRFQLVNERLVEVVTRRKSSMALWTMLDLPSVEVISTNSSSTLSISDINLIHWKLCKVVHHINLVFGSVFVFIVINSFCQFIFTSYFLLDLLQDGSIDYFRLFVTLNWLSIYVSQFYVFIWPFSLAVEEAHKTPSVASRLLLHLKDKVVISDLHELVSHLLNRDVEFTACDLFVLRVSVAISIASAVTTYLAIIVQIDQGNGGGDLMVTSTMDAYNSSSVMNTSSAP